MPKLSKKDKAERYDALSRDRDVWQHLSHLLINGVDPVAVETVTAPDGDVYEYRLYDVERFDGGTLVQVFRSDVNRRAMVDAVRFDDWCETCAKIPFGIGINTEVKIACERLGNARRAIFDKLREEAHQ